jgi:hypothetical protein
MTVELPVEDWNKVLAILAQAPWQAVNPLIMAIGEQLRAQAPEGRSNGADAEAAKGSRPS